MELLLKIDTDNNASIEEAIQVLNRLLGNDFVTEPAINLPTADALRYQETPVPPVPQSAPNVSQDLDSRGIPHDARVHSSSKAKLAKNGQWKPARGVDKDLLANVELELLTKAGIAGSGNIEDTPVPPAPVTPTETPTPPAPPVTPATNVTPINQATIEQPSMTVGDSTTLFQNFMMQVTSAGKSIEEINQACSSVGLPTVNTLLANPGLIPAVKNLLGLTND